MLTPLRDRLYVERVTITQSKGGILFPACFKAGKHGSSARQKMNAIRDHYEATVIAVGPEVRELRAGDRILVWSFAEGDGSKLYTGEGVGEKNRLFIRLDDVVCALDLEEQDLVVGTAAE